MALAMIAGFLLLALVLWGSAYPQTRELFDTVVRVAASLEGRLLVLAQERAWYEQDQGLRTSAWSSRCSWSPLRRFQA